MPSSIKAPLEKSFNQNLQAVRVHTDSNAHTVAHSLSTRAVTYGNHIFLGAGERSTDLRVMAHEAAHVVQQRGAPAAQPFTTGHGDAHEHEAEQASAAVMRGESFSVRQQTAPRPQGLFGISLPNPLNWLANQANNIPGFRMLTIIFGVNPINGSPVARSAANILRALVEFLPGGGLITQALDNYGVFDRAGAWVEQQIASLGMTAGTIVAAVRSFISSLSPSDILHLGSVWDRARRIFSEPIDRLISFGRRMVNGIIGLIKDAILMPLARLASQTRGWDLLTAVLGQNPITGEAVPRNAETLIGGFMKLIGQEEVWNNLKRAHAVERAWAWFQGALSGLLGFVRQIPGLFMQALRSLELMDLVLLPRAFVRVGTVFGSFLGQFFSWAGEQVMSLLQIIFAVLAPEAMPYIRRAGSALRLIFSNPIGFLGNLVRAGIQGFRQFGANFLTHLRTSLISWLTGTMSGANIYIPQAFNLREIIKFVLSVLGLTWQNIRTKLVRAIGETAVRALETGFEIVRTLVTEGPAAAWQQIVQSITNLRDMVMEQVMNFVRQRVVEAAITRLLTSLNPAGAFIQAVMGIYNTVMFFIERLQTIARVAMSFIDSMAAIASGAIGAAANRVEQTMAGLLTLVISFLARIAGLGRVSDAVLSIVNRVRAPIDRALDRTVEWIVAQARRLGRAVAQAGVPQDPNERLRLGARAAVAAARRLTGRVTRALLTPVLAAIKIRYGLTDIQCYEQGGRWWARVRINPDLNQDLGVSSAEPTGPVTAEEAERQRRATEETRTRLRSLMAAGAPKPRIDAAIRELRTQHRWQTLELQPAGANRFHIRGGFSPSIDLIDVEGALWVIQLQGVNVPASARAGWAAYENWVRNNIVRGSAANPGLAQLVQAGTGVTTPPRNIRTTPAGRTRINADTELPTSEVEYYREPTLDSRDRPDAVILAPDNVVYVEITLKSDWMMLEPQTGREGREVNRLNSQRIHKISQIPAHIFQLALQFPNALRMTAIIISDAPPSPASRARIQEWLSTQLGGIPGITVVWTIV